MNNETEALFDRVLSEYPGGVIAGGAVRDAELNGPIKDIDLWLSLDDFHLSDAMASDFDAREYLVHLEDPEPFVVSVWTAQHDWCPYPIHIMVVDPDRFSVRAVLERFDFGLCMIAYVDDGVYTLDAFVHDVQHQTLTLINGDFTSQERYERLKAKFPGWAIDRPESFQQQVSKAAATNRRCP